jgi:hydrogenase-4 component F
MLFSIIGLVILFAMTREATGVGTLDWNVLREHAASLPPGLFAFAFIFIFIGFAAKAGIVPFHTWLPQAHAKAPSVISVLLSAVLLNIGIYGILRISAIGRLNPAWSTISNILTVFGVLTVAVGALSMLPRGNLKKLIAFSSVEHMGFILIGIGLGTPLAVFWLLFHTLAHALVKSLLFFSAGILHQQYHSNQLDDMKDMLKYQPLASWGLIIGTAAIVGMPVFPVFLSKLNILLQLASSSLPVLFAVLVMFLIVASAFAALLIKAIPQHAAHEYEPFTVSLSMRLPIVVLILGVVVTGLYFPTGLQHMLEGIVADLGF